MYCSLHTSYISHRIALTHLSALTAQRTIVFFIVVTDGTKNCRATFCSSFTPPAMAACAADLSCRAFTSPTLVAGRKAELTAAAASLGVPSSRIRMLGLDDAGLEAAP
jgi:LmbE family N-acetylglucosaminyl deacetylase